jgi:hypothetical protein
MFVPNYEDGGSIVTNPNGTHSFTCDTTQFGCWTATLLVTTTAWANGGGSLAGVQQRLRVRWSSERAGRRARTCSSTPPSAAPGRVQPEPSGAGVLVRVSAGSPYDGQKLIYCAGKDIPDSWGGTSDFGLDCDMTGGSSGGPGSSGSTRAPAPARSTR